MATSGKFDTIDTVKVKIINNVRMLAETLQVASDDLRAKGHNVPDGQVYIMGIGMSILSINPETMVIELLRQSKELWDDIFAIKPESITVDQINKIKISLPVTLSSLVSPLLECRDENGVLALDVKILRLLVNYLKAFVKLGLKVVYFNRSYEQDLAIDLSQQLKLREVTGLPA